MRLLSFVLLTSSLSWLAAADPAVEISFPPATILGATDDDLESFLGIPFAQQPVGSLRLKPPEPLTSDLGTVNATGTPRACPQFYFPSNMEDFPGSVISSVFNSPIFQTVTNSGEDCLNLNIIRPAGTTAESNLPVLFWIYGGAFELGSTQMYDGSSIVRNSIEIGKPVIFVAVNYRVGGFGFLPGKEIKADGAGNLGLLDQRLGLKWVADNIAAFGGDASKVTIWGQSAGSISCFDQMALYDGNITYKGKPLFRGAIMESGSVLPAHDIDARGPQEIYNTVVQTAGCSAAPDTLECLRNLEFEKYMDAVNSVPGLLSYKSVALSYVARPDGVSLTASPEVLAQDGKFAKVPFIIGDQEDQGTLFSIFSNNVTTTDELYTYLTTVIYPATDPAAIKELLDVYPDNPSQGCPYRTMNFINNWYPQFKRIASIFGDLIFTLTRRALLDLAVRQNPDIPVWSYQGSYDHGTPIMGTFHGAELLQVFYGIKDNFAARSIRSYHLSFVYDLNPNSDGGFPYFPSWNQGKEIPRVEAGSSYLIKDNFRSDCYAFYLDHIHNFKL